MRCGVDTGGTFTDVVTDDGRVVKVLSSPDDPGRAVGEGLHGLRPELLAHGTTVATNALIERRGATVALVTTTGFADVIEIARQDRPSLYDIWADRREPLVPRRLRLEVDGRLDAAGREIEPLGTAPHVPDEVEAVAVCLLHADLDPAHERAVAADLRASGLDVSTSHEVPPEFLLGGPRRPQPRRTGARTSRRRRDPPKRHRRSIGEPRSGRLINDRALPGRLRSDVVL